MPSQDYVTVSVVFDMETTPARPFPLGALVGAEEDIVFYTSPTGGRKSAPVDCVEIVDVQVPVSYVAARD